MTTSRRSPVLLKALVCAVVGAVAWTIWIPAEGSAQTPTGGPPSGERVSLAVDRAALRTQAGGPELVERVDASAFRYFRLLAGQFAGRTCDAFRDLRWRLPFVAVHGDAHIEQFVVTNDSYGLVDFDRAAFGPAVVDLVRYAASIHLACREAAWSCDPDRAVASYFSAYHAALDRPVERTQPAAVERLRTPRDQRLWLAGAERLMRPMTPADEQAMQKGWPRFVALMRETSPERPESFYRIVRAGSIRLGLGSGLEPKTLIRIAGPSDSPDDDVILEARIAVPPAGPECLSRPTNGASLHVPMFTAILAQRLPAIFGFLPRDDTPEPQEVWIQSWDPGYRELALADLQGQADLNELAADAGTQLAGHFWTTFPEPLRGHQRFAQLRAFELAEQRARDLAAALARETVAEWNRFREQR